MCPRTGSNKHESNTSHANMDHCQSRESEMGLMGQCEPSQVGVTNDHAFVSTIRIREAFFQKGLARLLFFPFDTG
jgi:hypothetical protein